MSEITPAKPPLSVLKRSGALAVRALGFRGGLHTAGPYPDRFARLLPDLDRVGFDVKTPFADYEHITGVPGSGARARESLTALIESGIAFDVRATVHPLLLSEADLAARGTGRCDGSRSGRRGAAMPNSLVPSRPVAPDLQIRSTLTARGGRHA